jgi:aminoglycoside phosphotransferase (APT) family kinase protein
METIGETPAVELVARGRDADVFDAGPGRVLRRFRDRGKSVEREARVMVHARSHGVPVPEVFDADGPDLVMERVDGPTMAAALARRPWELGDWARTLAEVHGQVHAAPGPEWLGRPFGDGGALLHLDLHPENVLLVDGSPVVIDWTNAAAGPPEADVADAWLVVSAARPTGGRLVQGVAALLQRRFADRFLTATGADVRTVAEAAGARRLADRNLRDAERARIERLVQQASH